MLAMQSLERTFGLSVPDVDDLACMPARYFGGGRVLPALVPACCIDMGLLDSFRELMAECGQPVLSQCMRYDRVYALERIATAHGIGGTALRRLSVILFERYVNPGDDGLC
jgi:hypothetical protein